MLYVPRHMSGRYAARLLPATDVPDGTSPLDHERTEDDPRSPEVWYGIPYVYKLQPRVL